MLYFIHANEHISFGLKGSISKINGLISAYSYYPFAEVFKVIEVHERVFSEWHWIVASLSWTQKFSEAAL